MLHQWTPVGLSGIQIAEAPEAEPTSYFGTIKQSEEATLSYQVGAKPTATEGLYSVPLVLTWDVSGTSSTSTLYIGIRIKKKEASFTLSSVEPQVISPGESAVLEVVLKNTGNGFAENLTADLDSSDTSPVDPVGATKTFIERRITPGDEVRVSYTVNVPSGTSEDVYYTPLVLGWESYVDGSATLQIGVQVKGGIRLGIASVSSDPSSIRSGDDNVKVTVSVENSGEADAKNIRAALKLEQPFQPSYSQSDEAYLGRLASSESQTAAFTLDVTENTVPGKYLIPLTISYEDSNGRDHSAEESVALLVEPKPYFRISSTRFDPVAPTAGSHVLLYVEVENIGHETAESLDLRVIRESGQPFDYDTRSDFIGTLKPGEKGTAVLVFDVDAEAAAKEYLFKLLVRSTGDSELGDTNVYTQELKASVTIEEGKPESKGSTPLPVIIAVIAALGIGFLVGRRKKT